MRTIFRRPETKPRLLDVLSISEYTVMVSGQFFSMAGDQWASVALTVLVYERTRSPWWTAVTYAGSYLPWLVGGLVLSVVADRLPRRTVLLCCDLVRCLMVAAMALPGMPLPAVAGLLFLVTFLQAPFLGARSATLREILPEARYPVGIAIAQTSALLAAVAGFASGGLLVGVLGARLTLAADSATFAASALCIMLGVKRRPAVGGVTDAIRRRVLGGIRLVFSQPVPRTMMLFGSLSAFYAVPEALAVPYAARLGGGPSAAGLVFAAFPLGAAVAAPVFTKVTNKARQARCMAPMAVLCSSMLVLCLAHPGLAWSLAIFAATGALSAYQVAANTQFVQAVSPERRGHAFGIAGSLAWTSQGVMFLLAGAVASALSPATTVAIFGGAGAVAAIALSGAAWWRDQQNRTGRWAAETNLHERAPAASEPAAGSSATCWQCRGLLHRTHAGILPAPATPG